MRVRPLAAVVPALFALLAAAPAAHAQFGGLRLPGPFGGRSASAQLTRGFQDQLAKALGDDAPLRLDQRTSLPQCPPPEGFLHPRKLTSIAELNAPLAPGDYAVDATFYCTEYSIHRPAFGLPYKLARVQGRLVKPICALLNRGTLAAVDPAVLNCAAWRIEAGVPESAWPDADRALAHRLIPDYESDIQGDYIQDLHSKYDRTIQPVTQVSFDDELATMGALGQQVLSLEQARQILMDQSISDDQLPDMLYQRTGPGGNPVMASDSDHPSPWMQILPGVIGRYTIVGGYLRTNTFEFRVSPGAGDRGQVTLAQIMGQDETLWTTGPYNLIGYPVSQEGAQDPIISVILTDAGHGKGPFPIRH